MKKKYTNLKYLAALLLSASLLACESNRTVENTTETTTATNESEDTARVVQTGKTAEEQLAEFRDWINDKTTGNDTIEGNGTGLKEEFKEQTAYLERRMDSLSAKSRAEYEQLKSRYDRWEDRQDRRLQTPLNPQKVDQWQEQLLGKFKDLSTVNDRNAREAYLTFMGEVRARCQKWTLNDWDYVDHVYGLLNQRMRQIDDLIDTSDKIKIRTLQAEYLSLEAAADTQSMLGTMTD